MADDVTKTEEQVLQDGEEMNYDMEGGMSPKGVDTWKAPANEVPRDPNKIWNPGTPPMEQPKTESFFAPGTEPGARKQEPIVNPAANSEATWENATNRPASSNRVDVDAWKANKKQESRDRWSK